MTLTEEQIQTRLLKGRIIRLISTSDPYTKLQPGSMGVVTDVSKDITGLDKVHVKWENGSSLSLLQGEDSYHIFTEREQFLHMLTQYVQSAHNLLGAWMGIRYDEVLDREVESTQWPFSCSFDEYCMTMHDVLEDLQKRLS